MIEKFKTLDAMGKNGAASADDADDDEHAPWPVRMLVSASFFTNVVSFVFDLICVVFFKKMKNNNISSLSFIQKRHYVV